MAFKLVYGRYQPSNDGQDWPVLGTPRQGRNRRNEGQEGPGRRYRSDEIPRIFPGGNTGTLVRRPSNGRSVRDVDTGSTALWRVPRQDNGVSPATECGGRDRVRGREGDRSRGTAGSCRRVRHGWRRRPTAEVAMTRTDSPRIAVRRAGHELALKELYLDPRAAHEALRHAHHALAPFALCKASGLRSGPKPSTRLEAQSRLVFGWDDLEETPPHGLKSSVPLANQEAIELRDDFRTHLNHIRWLKEENRRLCEEVARLVRQQRAEPRRRATGPPRRLRVNGPGAV